MRDKLNCPNCGAPITSIECPYCSSVMTNVPEIVNTLESGIDQTHYAYALCECIPAPFSVRVPISDGTRRGLVRFRCPKCKKELGVWYRGGDQDD